MQENSEAQKNIAETNNTQLSISVFMVVLIIILSSAISIAAIWWFFERDRVEIVVADISKIVEDKKKSFIDSYKLDSSQENMAKIDKELVMFLNNLDFILSEHSNNRIILKREAVIDGKYEDITEQIRNALSSLKQGDNKK